MSGAGGWRISRWGGGVGVCVCVCVCYSAHKTKVTHENTQCIALY